jgi:uncharacterized membrane protein
VFTLPEAKMLSFFGVVPPGHWLDIPNGILGMIFYTYIFTRYTSSGTSLIPILSVLFQPGINMIISALAMASSLFLGRKLFEIKEVCVVCLTTHMINATLFFRSLKEMSKGGVKCD